MRPPLLLLALVLSACAHRDGTRLEATAPGTQQRSGGIVLDLRTDQTRYRAGDPIRVTLTTSQPARIEICNLDAKGQRTPIWPRPGTSPAPLSPSETLTLPPQGADWQLTASAPHGVNTLVAQATSLPKPTRPRPTSSTTTAPARPEFFQMHTGGWKGMSVQPTASPASSPSAPTGKRTTGEARWLYQVQ